MRRGGRVQTRLKPAGVLHLGDDPAKSAKRLKEEQFCGGKGVPEMRMTSRTTVDLMRGPSGSSARCTLPSIVVRNDGMLAMARSPTDL
ncbi:hypothetical protein V1477_010811 [Vespula maculifrons]|uniref:Uncharacterized protein n=1 Tax=Vespula maculifrons TaxID=7453 RepID=A0ABD2C2Z5_VESMC